MAERRLKENTRRIPHGSPATQMTLLKSGSNTGTPRAGTPRFPTSSPSSSSSARCSRWCRSWSQCACCGPRISRLLAYLSPRQHLTARLLWILSLLVAVYLIAIVLSVDFIATRLVNQQTGESYTDFAFQTSNLMDRIMYERWREAANIAKLPEVYDNPGSNTFLTQLLVSYKDYAWLGITDVNGTVIAASNGLLVGVDVRARDWWYKTRDTQKQFVGDVHQAILLAKLLPNPTPNDPLRFVDITAPLFLPGQSSVCTNSTDANGAVQTSCTTAVAPKFHGVLGFHLSWAWARRIHDQVLSASRVDEGVELLIFDHTGLCLLGPTHLAQQRLPGLKSIQAAARGELGHVTEAWPDGDWLTGYSPSTGYSTYPGLGWLIIVRQTRSRALEPANYLRMVILLIVLLLGAFLVGVTGLAISLSIKPLRDMSRVADKITEQLVDAAANIPSLIRKQGGISTADKAPKSRTLHRTQTSASLAPINVSMPPLAGRHDEIGHLNVSLSSLLIVLNAHRHELQNINAGLELKVQSRTVELEMINRELEMFSQTVSHDLRAPLGSIRTATELILMDLQEAMAKPMNGSYAEATASTAVVPTDGTGAGSNSSSGIPPTVLEYLNQIQSDVTTMTGLITDLLELSRINHSQMRLKRVDLAALVRNIVTDLKRNDPVRAQHVTVLLPGDMRPPLPSSGLSPPSLPISPPPNEEFIVNCDEGLVRVVLTNLLSNAWKYSSKQPHAVIEFGVTYLVRDRSALSPSGTARSPTTGAPRTRVFYVRDNGAGFDMQHARRLFKPFQRMHKQSDFKGVGVGLSTVSRCCQRHEGRVWAKSARNKGATFFFTLEKSHVGDGESAAGLGLSHGTLNGPPTTISPPPAMDDADGGSRSTQVEELPPLPSAAALAALQQQQNRDTPVHQSTFSAASTTVNSSAPSSSARTYLASPTGEIPASANDSVGPASSPATGEDDSRHPQVTFHEATDEDAEDSAPSNLLVAASLRKPLLPPPIVPPPPTQDVPGGAASAPTTTDAGNINSLFAFEVPPLQSASSDLALTMPASPSISTALPPASNSSSNNTPARRSIGPRHRRPLSISHQSNSSDDSSSAPCTILFVDDSFINCKLGSRILSSNGCLVDTAGDGLEVLTLLYPGWRSNANDAEPNDDSNGRADAIHLQVRADNGSADASVVGDIGGVSPITHDSHLEWSTGPNAPVTHVGDDPAANPASSQALMHGRSIRQRLALVKRYDLIVMDLEMPIMDGLTCIAHLRALGYPGRVIALTGHDDDAKKEECYRAGFDTYLTKPWSAAQLMDLVNQHRGKQTDWRPAA